MAFTVGDANTLFQCAAGDFLHDFSDPGRSDVTLNILNRVPIEYSKTPSKNYAALTQLITTARENAAASAIHPGDQTPAQAYWVFRDTFGFTVPTPGLPPLSRELDILHLANIPYDWITNKLTAKDAQLQVVNIGTASLGFTNKHNYDIKSAATKIGGVHQPLAPIFSRLSGGITNFVLMWDAGAITITKLAENAEGGPYRFFFVRSKENLSDPAGKISVDSMRSSANVHIYFLEDQEGHTSQYPMYSDGGTVNENLFSSFTLTTRSEKNSKVSGTIGINNADNTTTSIFIPDVGLQSEVGETIIKTIHMKLNDEPIAEIMPYFFLKRAGDWCQALCLLDRERKYNVLTAPMKDNTPWESEIGDTTSIIELEGEGALVAMVTLDRIMLAYLIAAGIDVFYTNVRSGCTWLTLFKNTDAGRVDDADALMGRIDDVLAKAAQMKESYAEVVAKLDELPPASLDEGFSAYVIQLRQLCMLLKSLPTPDTIDSIAEVVIKSRDTIIASGKIPEIVGILRSSVQRLTQLHSNYPTGLPTSSAKDKTLEQAITNLMANILGQNPVSRIDPGFSAFSSFVNDIKDVRALPPIELGDDLGAPFQLTRTSIPEERHPIQVIVKHWNATSPMVGGAGEGSVAGKHRITTFDECYQVYAYNPENSEDIAIAALLELNNIPVAALGSQVMLPSGFLATVSDDILIDDDSYHILEQSEYENPEDPNVVNLKLYKAGKFEIYELDSLEMRLRKLRSADATNTVAKQELFDVFSELSEINSFEAFSKSIPDTLDLSDVGSWIDEWVVYALGYPSDKVEDPNYEQKANGILLSWITKVEVALNAARVGLISNLPIRPHETPNVPELSEGQTAKLAAAVETIMKISVKISDGNEEEAAKILAGIAGSTLPGGDPDLGGGRRKRRPLYSAPAPKAPRPRKTRRARTRAGRTRKTPQ